jgi:hypothetical protein
MKKIILPILTIIIGTIFIKNVSSKTATLTLTKTNYYWTRTLNGKKQSWYMYHYNFGEKIAYCIEPGIDEGITYEVGDFLNTDLDENMKEQALLIAYYGYEYPTHQKENYRFATQALIWEAFGIPDTVYSTERFETGEILDVTKEKEEIKKLVSEHDVAPTFKDSYDIKISDTLTLQDENEVLENYEILPSLDFEYEIKDNTLSITPKIVGKIKVTLKQKIYTNEEYLVYYGENIQTMISSGKINPTIFTFEINVTGGTLEIQKIDADTFLTEPSGNASLENAVYALYDENDKFIQTVTTNKEGYAKIDALPSLGTFYIKEIESPKGYLKSDEVYTFKSSQKEADKKIIIQEQVIKKDITITKVYASNTSTILTVEPNITFAFYNSKGELYKQATTNEEGKIKITLPYDTYTVKQVNTSYNTEKMEDFKITVEDTKELSYTISDAVLSSFVKVNKIDSKTKEKIKQAGILFKIKNKETNEYVTWVKTYPNYEVIDTFKTDETGSFITPVPLDYGTYLLEEIDQTLNGYTWNDTPLEFQIDNNTKKQASYGNVVEVNFENELVKGKINIQKYGEMLENGIYKPINLSDVKLALYAKEDIIENDTLIYPKDTWINTFITDEKGQVQIENLPLGTYYIKEQETTLNHVLDTNQYDISLEYKDQYTKTVEETLTLYNHLKKEEVKTIEIPNTYQSDSYIGEIVLLISGIAILIYETIKY